MTDKWMTASINTLNERKKEKVTIDLKACVKNFRKLNYQVNCD